MLDIKITKAATLKAKPADETKLGFGKIFTDHMFLMEYTRGQGWHDARIVPYAPFVLDPACVVFHYAQEIFEGMKAYRAVDGTIQLFRPDCNAQRMQDSCDRLCINIRTEFLQFCKFLFLALIIEFANFLHHFLNPFPFVCNLFPQIADFRSVLRHSRNAAAHLFKNICHCHRPLSFVNFMMFQL